MAEETGFFNAQDGVKGRDGGPYLDQIERYNAAKQAAAIRGEAYDVPFHEVHGPSVGTSVVRAGLVVDNSTYSNPSVAGREGLETTLTTKTFTENDNFADPMVVATSASDLAREGLNGEGKKVNMDTGDVDGEDSAPDVSNGDKPGPGATTANTDTSTAEARQAKVQNDPPKGAKSV